MESKWKASPGRREPLWQGGIKEGLLVSVSSGPTALPPSSAGSGTSSPGITGDSMVGLISEMGGVGLNSHNRV